MSASTTTRSPTVRLMGKRPASMTGCIPSIITRLSPVSGCIQPPFLGPPEQTLCQCPLVLRPGAAHGELLCQYGRANGGTQYPVWRGGHGRCDGPYDAAHRIRISAELY